MCILAYIASDHPLPLIPWNEASPSFYVSELAQDETRVRKQFTKSNVFHLGSHEGCGCGFQYGQYPDVEDDPDRLAKKRESCMRLSDYISTVVKQYGSVEIFSCWDGDQEETASREQATPDHFMREDFSFKEKQLLYVVPKVAG